MLIKLHRIFISINVPECKGDKYETIKTSQEKEDNSAHEVIKNNDTNEFKSWKIFQR